MPTILAFKPTRMYTPVDDKTQKRTLLHPETNSDNVVVLTNGKMLTETLEEMKPVVSEDKPDHACMWFHVTETTATLF